MIDIKNIMSESDYNLYLSYIAKGKRIGDILNNPKCSGNYKTDAIRGGKKLHHQKAMLLKKYNINVQEVTL